MGGPGNLRGLSAVQELRALGRRLFRRLRFSSAASVALGRNNSRATRTRRENGACRGLTRAGPSENPRGVTGG
jgi:hypothetical protein